MVWVPGHVFCFFNLLETFSLSLCPSLYGGYFYFTAELIYFSLLRHFIDDTRLKKFLKRDNSASYAHTQVY